MAATLEQSPRYQPCLPGASERGREHGLSVLEWLKLGWAISIQQLTWTQNASLSTKYTTSIQQVFYQTAWPCNGEECCMWPWSPIIYLCPYIQMNYTTGIASHRGSFFDCVLLIIVCWQGYNEDTQRGGEDTDKKWVPWQERHLFHFG